MRIASFRVVGRGPAALVGLAMTGLGGCAGALPPSAAPCGPQATRLDGVCVSQRIADYVACVRARAASLGEDKSASLKAAAGVAGVGASGAWEARDTLDKKYYKTSDANETQIIHDCYDGSLAGVTTTQPLGGQVGGMAAAHTASDTPGERPYCNGSFLVVPAGDWWLQVTDVDADAARAHLVLTANAKRNWEDTILDRSAPPPSQLGLATPGVL
jgi:hypothetical protein